MSESITRHQNKMLNCEKALACILVIILHCEFPTLIGSVINIFARIGVPLFFMISGFFAISKVRDKTKKRLREKIFRTFRLVLIYYLLNIIFDTIVKCSVFQLTTISEIVSALTDLNSLKDAILWNRTLLGIGGWFLPALAFCYGIAYFLYDKNKLENAHKLILPLLAGYFIISRATDMPVWYSRNYLFDGLPFFLLGVYCSQNKERIIKVSNPTLLALVAGGGFLGCLERFSGGYDLYLGVIVATVAAFAFAIKNETYTLGRCLEFIGEKLTLHCYLIHPLVLQVLKYCETVFNIQGMIFEWCRPIVIIVCTLMLSQLVYMVQSRIKK